VLVKTQINSYQGSLPTLIFTAVKQIAKGLETIAYLVTLLTAKNYNLRKANKVLSKYRKAKITYICQGSILTVEDVYNLLAQKKAEKQVE